MGATQSNGNRNTKLSLADRRYRVNSPRADSLVQQRLSARKLGGVALEPREQNLCPFKEEKEEYENIPNEAKLNLTEEDKTEIEEKRTKRRQSCSNNSITSQETNNTSPSRFSQFMQRQNLQMSRIENSATVLTILLTRTQRVLIENSWKRAKKGAADGGVGSRVFHTVLTAQPDIKLLFGLEKVPQGRLKYEGQFRRHACVLTRALEYIIKNVQYTDKLGIHFQTLGKKHCQMNGGRAFPTHYWDTFLECIIQSLLECDGTSGGRKHRCRETATAWRNLISFIVQQMRRGFEDERLLRKRFSASLIGIRGVKSICSKSSERSLKSTVRPLVSIGQQHNVLHQSFGSLDGSFPFSLQGFNDSTKQNSSVLPINGRVRASSSISPLAAESLSKCEGILKSSETASKQYNFDRLMPSNQYRKSGDISTINNNNIQNSTSSARSASWCAEVTAEQMQKMNISSTLEKCSKEEEDELKTYKRTSWSVSSVDGVTEVFYTPKTVPPFGNENETIPGPALTAIKLLLDSATNGEDEHRHIIQEQSPTSSLLIYARHSFSDFESEESINKEREQKQAFNASQKLLSVAQANISSQNNNSSSSPSQIRRLSAL